MPTPFSPTFDRQIWSILQRRWQKERETVCPDCGRLRTNLKRHRGSKLCRKVKANA